jgi:hypothetical protein
MNPMMKCARFLVLLMAGLWLAAPTLADDGDGGAATVCDFIIFAPGPGPYPCPDSGHGAQNLANHSRPGSVIVFPLFVRNGGNAEECGAGNVLVNRVCLPRTEIELGATCPTRFTVGNPGFPESQPPTPCPEHELVRVRFRWVCPATHFEHKFICRTTRFDVSLTVNGKIVFTANGFSLPDANHVRVPTAPCEKGYLIGWVIDEFGRPIKYDGLIGEAVIRNSGTAVQAHRGITIQAFKETQTRSLITRVPDPFDSQRLGLPFSGVGST